MEAATPLRKPSVRAIGDSVVIEALTVEDETAARLVREREEAGKDPAASVADAIEIGARVLDREQTGANADFVKAEFEKVSHEVEQAFTERARQLTDQLDKQLAEVFGPESGHLARALERHFSDGSTEAVQNRVKAVLDELGAKQREDLLRMFSSGDGKNPLADFKNASLGMIKQASDRQDTHLRGLLEKLSVLEKEVQRLHDERDKELDVAEAERAGTRKGRTFEEAVCDAIEAIAAGQGDDCEAVGDVKGATRKTGDIVVGVDGARGAAKGRIVFEAKDRKSLSRNEAVRELDRGRQERDADYAVMIVPSEDRLPARTQQLRELNGDKTFAVYDPDDGSTLALELAYRLARARVLMTRGGDGAIDGAALAEIVERALGALNDVQSIKQKLTGATSGIDAARDLLDSMAGTVRGHLGQMDALLAGAQDD